MWMDGVQRETVQANPIRPCRKEETVKLSAPKSYIWIISLVLGAAGLLGYIVTIPVITGLAFWLVLVGLGLLLLATAIKGL
jgi:hypothetical protein